MKKVFIHAYLSYNLGDDLMVLLLCRRYPKVRFFVIADENYRQVFRDVPNLEVLPYDGRRAAFWNRVWKTIKKTEDGFWKMMIRSADVTIHIGGSSFVQHFDDYGILLNSDRTLRRLSKRMIAIGMNFGPYTDENFYKDYYELLKSYDGVTLRDRASYRLFEQLPNVRQAADVVFGYGKEVRNSDIRTQKKKQVLISVIQMETRNGKFAISQYAASYRQFIAALSKEYLKKGFEVKFISFCGPQGDEKAVNEMIAELKEEYGKAVSGYYYRTDIRECIRQFEEARIVVGTRFHSIILGWLYGKEVLPIVYDTKTQNLLDDLGYSTYVKLEELQSADVRKLAAGVHGLKAEMVQKLITDAENQFWAADRWLQ